jgi:large subunit ribosomal protein L1
MAKTCKRMKKAYEGIDRIAEYALSDAIKIVTERSTTKFDETVDIAIKLNVDPRKADQNIRGMVQLPNGTGKTIRVAVFAKGDKAVEAEKAGADIVGADDLAEKIQAGEMNFDRCIATPDMMPLVGKLGKILGPKGLMPNPKLGTVTPNVKVAVEAAKAGQVEYRAEKEGIVHSGVGKVSFTQVKIEENIKAFAGAVMKARPASVKGTYVERVSISSTMGPSVKVKVSDLASA